MNPEQQQDFTDFVVSRSESLIRLAYVLTNDQHAAEDLLQTALAKAAGRWRTIRDNPEGYVRPVMYHEQVGRWRSPRWRRERVVEEPWAYKDIGPVVSSLHRAGVAEPVVELRPLLTVKG